MQLHRLDDSIEPPRAQISRSERELRFAPIDPVRWHLIRVIWISAGLDLQTLLM